MGKNIELEQLVINKLTQEQYDALAVKNPGELYFITDANPTKEVETQLAELSEKVPEPISTYESFPEATAENVGMRVVYTGETIEAPYIENEDGSVSTVFLDPYLTRGHTFMLVPVQVLTSETESITIYMWQDVIGAIPPFDYDMAGQVLSTNGMGYEWTELPEAGLTKEEADQTYLPLSGGTLTGPLQMKLVGGNGACIAINRQGNDSLPSYNWTIESSAATCALSLKSNYGTPCVFYSGFINPGSPSSTIGSTTQKWSRIYAKTLNNDADLTIPTEGGTIARLEDIPESTQVETIPEASVDSANKIYQYTGETSETYSNGHFYKCAEDITITLSMMSSFVSNDSSATLDSEKFVSQNPIFADADTSNTPYPAWRADYQEGGTWNVWTQTPNLSITADELASVWGITISGTPEVGDMIAVMKQEEATYAWTEVVLGEKLPDQTDNAGKFLQTNGTEVSWGNALVNQSSNISSLAIGNNSYTSGTYALALGFNSNAFTSSLAIGYQAIARAAKSVAFGNFAKAAQTAEGGVAIGYIANAEAKGSIQISSAGASSTNSDADTFKVANTNGNFEIMSADGTIPTDRYTTTPTTAGTYVPKLTIAGDGTATREWGPESGGTGGDYLPLSGGTISGTFSSTSPALIISSEGSEVYGIQLHQEGGNGVVFSANAVGGFAITPRGVTRYLYFGNMMYDNSTRNLYNVKNLNNGADIAVPTTGGTMVVATPPTDNGTYVLKATVVDGVVTTEWVLES